MHHGDGLDPMTFFHRVIYWAIWVRIALITQGAYMIAVGLTLPGDEHLFFNIGWLHATRSFVVGGLACFALAWRATQIRHGIIICLILIGFPMLCRAGMVISTTDDIGIMIRATGWGVMWMFTVAATTTIIAADAMRERLGPWNG